MKGYLQMKIQSADQPGKINLSFQAQAPGDLQFSVFVDPEEADHLEVGTRYLFTLTPEDPVQGE